MSHRLIQSFAADARVRLPGCCAVLSDRELWDLCDRAIIKAAVHGIFERDDLIPFVDVVLAHGLNFETLEELDWTQSLLNDVCIEGDLKVAVLLDRMPSHLLPEAISNAAFSTPHP